MNFDAEITFDPAADFVSLLAKIPAKWVVYLMSDEQGAPVQLLCVKNLRASLQRRLGENEQIGPSKRVGYRDLVRKIAWRRVDSAFEADLVYLELARQIFPQTYRGMLAFKEAWFLHVDPASPFPRYTKINDPAASLSGFQLRTQNLELRTPILIGPIKDKHAAGRLIELIEDTFDLCRYHNILLESPRGKACAYKEMGRCDAPCDGSVPIENYHAIIRKSIEALSRPEQYHSECEAQMKKFAAELNFEKAGKIKTHLDREARLHAGQFSHLHSLADFRFISIQRGPGEKKAKLFLITPTRIEEALDLCQPPESWSEIVAHLHSRMGEPDPDFDRPAAERLAIVASHLLSPKKQGVILPYDQLTEKTLADAYRQLSKQKVEEESIDEGVVKDLQVM